MTEGSIIEIWAPEPLETALIGYVQGLVDLGIARSLFVVRGDGSAARFDGGTEIIWYSDIREAFGNFRPESCQIVTVTTLPLAEHDPMESTRDLLFAGAFNEDIVESLLVCPTYDSDLDEYTHAFDLIDECGRSWDRLLLLSPEDLRRAGEVALPIRSDLLTPLAGAMGTLLVGAIDGAMSANRLPSSPVGEIWVVRGFVNLLDVGAATTEAISEALDGEELQVFDDDQVASIVDNPLRSVNESAQSFVVEHRLVVAPYPRRTPAVIRGLLAALRALVAMMRVGPNWLPERFLNRGDVEAFNRRRLAVAQLVTSDTAEGLMFLVDGIKVAIEEPVDLFDDQLVDVRKALSRTGVRVADQWLPTATPEPEPAIWRGLADNALGMLDGFEPGDLTPVLAEPELSAPAPLPPDTVVGLLILADKGTPELVSLIDRPWPAPFITADPMRIDLLIDLLQELVGDPGNTENSGPSPGHQNPDRSLPSGVLQSLQQDRVDANRSFTTRIGRAVADAFTAARKEFIRVLGELLDAPELVWDSKPERRARRWVTGAIVGFVAALAAVGFGLVAGEPLALAGSLVLGLVVIATILQAAVRYQASVNRRDHDLSQRIDSDQALSHYWLQVRRLSAVYRQYREWSTVLTADIHLPVGRPGNPIIYGGQRLRPRMLSGAISVDVDPIVISRIRRSIFQRGWRTQLHRHVVAVFLEDFRDRGGHRESPDPYTDVADQVGARRELVAAFVVPNGSPVTKRVELEAQAERILTVDGTESVVEHITGISLDRQRKEVETVGEFFDTSGEAPFARYSLGRGFFGRPESPIESRENGVHTTYRSVPAHEAPQMIREHDFSSERPAPDLTTVRIDTSFDVVVLRQDPGDDDAEPTVTLGDDDEEYFL